MLAILMFLPVLIGAYFYATSLNISGWIGSSISLAICTYLMNTTDWHILGVTISSAVSGMFSIRLYKSVVLESVYS